MKKFAMLMLLVGLFSYTVGCGGAEEADAPADPAPAADDTETEGSGGDETPTE